MTTTYTERATTTSPAAVAPARSGIVSRRLVVYTLIGGTGVALDYVLFLLLYNVAGVPALVANGLSISAAIAHSFTFNTLFNFRTRDRLLTRFARFYLVGMGGIALTSLMLALAGVAGLDPNLVKLASLPLVLIFQYSVNTRWSFA